MPSEPRSKEMTDGDYLYCILHLLLDQEEQLDQLCPACRRAAEEKRCPGCGAALGTWQGGENIAFDAQRFQALSRDGQDARKP